jgi:uncharacterized membrane protein
MSVSVEVYPEVLNATWRQGLRFVVHNPTNADQDITVKFQDDTGVFIQLVTTNVKPGEFRSTILSDEDLGLSERAGKTVVVYPEIPPPGTGVVLMGTNLAPSTRGNAVTIKASSTVKVTVVDEAGNPIPFADVTLLNMDNCKKYHYKAGADGVCYVPDRPTADYGRWAIEAQKVDYDRQIVAYGLIAPWDYTDSKIVCKWAKNFLIEITLHLPKNDNVVINAIKNAARQLPEPLRTFCNWLAGAFGWASDQVFNFVLPIYINMIKASSPNIVYVRQEDDNLVIGYNLGFQSPFDIVITPLAALVIIIVAISATFIAAFVSMTIRSWSPAATYEAQQKLLQQQQQMIQQATNAYQQGAITKEQFDQIISTIKETLNNFKNNIPPTIDITGIITLAVVVLVLILIISLIRAVRGKE